jgi:hypothetical protein
MTALRAKGAQSAKPGSSDAPGSHRTNVGDVHVLRGGQRPDVAGHTRLPQVPS